MELDKEKPAKSERPYGVGYGKPPVNSRFRPGVSGNPRGRPVGTRPASFAKNLAALAYDDIDAEEEALIASWQEDPAPKSTRRRRKRS